MGLLKRKSFLAIFATIIMVIGMLFATIPVKTAHAASGSESESNNTAATANTISVNTTISGNLSSNSDVDWFKFTTTVDGFFYLNFNHTLIDSSSDYWTVNLYDNTATNKIDGSSSYYSVDGNKNMKTNNFGIPAGTYYIKITKDYYSNKDYSINIVFANSNDWETEKNNTKETADKMSLNKELNASLSMNGDVDWFTFDVPTRGYFYLEFNHVLLDSSSDYWTVNLYDNSGVTKIDGSSSYYTVDGNKNMTTYYFGVDVGTYYIKVSKDYYSGNDYSLKINFTESTEWETEINNSKDTADLIEVNTVCNGSLSMNGDVDWYKFTVSSNCQVAISFGHDVLDSQSTYWTIILYDHTAVTKLYTYNRRGNTETAISDYVDITSGTYYVKVMKDYYSGKNYELSIIEKHDHRGEWIQTVEPTCTEGGSESRECTICGLVETRDLEALGHKYNSGEQIEEATIVKKGKIEYTCEQCGDQYTEDDKSKVWILPVICVGGVLVIIGLINYIRMMKKKN